MYMYAIFRSMGLIEVVMDVATCICLLSSEAWVSLKKSWMQLHVYVCYLQKHGSHSEAWVSLSSHGCSYMYMYAIFRSMGLIEVVMDVATCICLLSSEAWVSLK